MATITSVPCLLIDVVDMAPEYATYWKFSIKTDVFSFGVFALEIVTGRLNSGFQDSGDIINLLNFVSAIQ